MCKLCNVLLYSAGAKMIIILVFPADKNGFKSVFCCSVSVGNISVHGKMNVWTLIVIIEWYVCLKTASAPHRDLISSSFNIRWILLLAVMHSCMILHVVFLTHTYAFMHLNRSSFLKVWFITKLHSFLYMHCNCIIKTNLGRNSFLSLSCQIFEGEVLLECPGHSQCGFHHEQE